MRRIVFPVQYNVCNLALGFGKRCLVTLTGSRSPFNLCSPSSVDLVASFDVLSVAPQDSIGMPTVGRQKLMALTHWMVRHAGGSGLPCLISLFLLLHVFRCPFEGILTRHAD